MATLVPCKCGGKAKYCTVYMDDRYECDACGWSTRNYFDGAEYASDEWNRRNTGRISDVAEEVDRRMASLKRFVMKGRS